MATLEQLRREALRRKAISEVKRDFKSNDRERSELANPTRTRILRRIGSIRGSMRPPERTLKGRRYSSLRKSYKRRGIRSVNGFEW